MVFFHNRTPAPVVEMCECGNGLVDTGEGTVCPHCDFPCEMFPNCLPCGRRMEPDELGVTFAAEALLWKRMDDIAGLWWDNHKGTKA